MVNKISLFILLLFFFCACKNNQYKKVSKTDAPVVVILPYTDLDTTIINTCYASLQKQLPNIFLYKAIPLPTTAFYKPRNRFRADSIIHFESRLIGKDTVVIGMTSKDISTTKNDIKDWGVMGLGFCPGNACVVSSFRLSAKNKTAQFYKVAIHELGHTQGLPHCANTNCFMRDAEGGNPLDDEKYFCSVCKKFLQNKGWVLN